MIEAVRVYPTPKNRANPCDCGKASTFIVGTPGEPQRACDACLPLAIIHAHNAQVDAYREAVAARGFAPNTRRMGNMGRFGGPDRRRA